jgi:hypothetical protein
MIALGTERPEGPPPPLRQQTGKQTRAAEVGETDQGQAGASSRTDGQRVVDVGVERKNNARTHDQLGGRAHLQLGAWGDLRRGGAEGPNLTRT